MLGTPRSSLCLSACIWNLGDESFEPTLPSRWAVASTHSRDTPSTGLSWPILHHLCFLKSQGKSPPEIQAQGQWYMSQGRFSVLILKGLPFRLCSDKTSLPPPHTHTFVIKQAFPPALKPSRTSWVRRWVGSQCQWFVLKAPSRPGYLYLSALYWWGWNRLGHMFKEHSTGAQKTRYQPSSPPYPGPSSA